MAELPAEFFKHWVHSHEEDTGDVQVYRPADFDFPPARGRRGFEFGPGGEFVAYGPDRADRPSASAERWTPSSTGRVRVGDRELEIVSVEPDRLVARWA